MNPIFGKGVADKDIDLSIAETACELAIKKFSNDKKINLGLGRVYQKKKVYEKAFSYYKKAYQYGSGDAASAIASLYYRQVIPIDGDPFKKSYEWSSKAVDLGSAEGLWRMGVHYDMGWGVISDFKKALDYYFKSSKSGFSQANIDLGLYYKRGDLGLEKNLQKAKEYFLKEHKLGNPLGSLNLATLNLQESDDLSTVVTSAELIKDLANDEIIDAQYSYIYYNLVPDGIAHIRDVWPDFVPDKDEALEILKAFYTSHTGVIWGNDLIEEGALKTLPLSERINLVERIERVARNENLISRSASSSAATLLARYIYGKGAVGPKNIEKVVESYLLAIEYKNIWAMQNLGWLYYSEPAIQDADKAIKYSLMAAEQKESPYVAATALNNIGVIYMELVDNPEKAVEYYKKSAGLIAKSEFLLDWPTDNLARIYIFGKTKEGINLEKAQKYATASKENGSDLFSKILDKNLLQETTSIEKVKRWIVEAILDGETGGLIEMAWQAEDEDKPIEAIKWFSLCVFLCGEHNIGQSEEGLNKWETKISGIDFDEGLRRARQWRENVWQVNLDEKKSKDYIAEFSDQPNPLGKNYAVLIGINDYESLIPLQTPLRDVSKIGEILNKKYGYNVNVLENPSRSDILSELNKYKNILTENDNTLIYYAGHGLLDQDEGFWLPRNASSDDDINWISNSYIKRKLKSYNAINVLVVADSCFSGSLTRSIKVVDVKKSEPNVLNHFLKTKSRVAISSGGNEPVADGGGDGHSLFAKIFIDHLEKYEKAFTAMDLYNNLRNDVYDLSTIKGRRQTPLYGELVEAGHEGPDFVFVKKN